MAEGQTDPAGWAAHLQSPRNLHAAMLAMASTAILSFVDNFVAEVSQTHGLWQFQAMRALIALPLLILGAVLLRQRLRPVSAPRVALRSLTVSTGLLIYFAALGTLPVAQAGAGIFTAPIWVLLFSALLFRHGVSLMQGVAVLAGFGGVLMLLQPDPANLTPLSLFPLGAGLFYGLGMLLTRQICAGESAMALALGIFLAMGVLGAGLMLAMELAPRGAEGGFLTRGWRPLTGRFLWLTFFQGVGAIVAVTLIAQAYRIGTPSYVAVFEYSFLIFASLWAFLLWGQGTGLLAWGGIAVIIGSGLAMTFSRGR